MAEQGLGIRGTTGSRFFGGFNCYVNGRGHDMGCRVARSQAHGLQADGARAELLGFDFYLSFFAGQPAHNAAVLHNADADRARRIGLDNQWVAGPDRTLGIDLAVIFRP